MQKNQILKGIFIAAIAGSVSFLYLSKPTPNFKTIAQNYETKLFAYWPEAGLVEGKTDVDLDRFGDYSVEGIKAWEREEDKILAQLTKIDPQRLNRTEKLTYSLMKDTLQNSLATRICKTELWNVSPINGWHSRLVEIVDAQPVGTPQLREQAIKRWETFAKVSNAELNNLKLGLAQGYTAPKPAVERVINQLELMLTEDPKSSPFYSVAKRDGDPAFQKQMSEIIQEVINPELAKHIQFLKQDYLPLARESVGTSALKNGLRCYQAQLKQNNTLDKTPEEIHQIGLQQIDKISEEVAEIGQRLYGETDVASVFKKAKESSTGVFKSEQEMLDYNYAALAKVKAKVPQWFDRIPVSKGIVQPYPLHRAKTGAAGEYSSPDDTGTKPGIFYMNTYQPEHHSRIDIEATLYHELIPGHHFQIALQHEDKSLSPLNKFLANSGFIEGWGLYAERLADQMGVYQDDISRLGMLSNEAMRASRLVVDTGLHALGWTRQQAVDYMSSHTAVNENIIQGEVDRYIMLPGQATAYMLGKLQIEMLRDEAKQKLGSAFDIREFHNQVLKNGTVTLPMLAEQIHEWVDSQTAVS